MRKKHAPTEVLSSSKKIYLQRKVWNSHKIKELNKLNHKTVTVTVTFVINNVLWLIMCFGLYKCPLHFRTTK